MYENASIKPTTSYGYVLKSYLIKRVGRNHSMMSANVVNVSCWKPTIPFYYWS